MTVVKVPKGLMLINPLPPTQALVNQLKALQDINSYVEEIEQLYQKAS